MKSIALRAASAAADCGALRHGGLSHERRTEARLVEHLRRGIGGDDRLTAPAARLLLNVELSLDPSGDELVHLGELALAERREVMAAALRADLPLLGDLVLDPTGGELALLRRVLTSLLQRRFAIRLRRAGVADLVRDARHLLGALSVDVALELLDGTLERGDALAERGDRVGRFEKNRVSGSMRITSSRFTT
jgi:hypothetical protein